MTDSERIDALEAFINEHGALLLHDGCAKCNGHLGLGLRPGLLNRSLREAIDQMMVLRSTDMGKRGRREEEGPDVQARR